MCKVLTPIPKSIKSDLVKATHNIWGIITPEDKYISCYNAAFAVPIRTLLFNTTIPNDTQNSVLHQAEAENMAHRNDCALYNVSNNGVINFFRSIDNKTCYQDLENTGAYYSEVTATNMLAHFRDNCSGLYEVDTITIQGEMIDYFGQAKGILQYINTMKTAQASNQ